MDKNLEPYIVLTDDQIIFKGDTEEEKELNKWLYHTTLELNRYQDMVQELLEYAYKHQDSEEVNYIIGLIKEWNC